MGSTPTPSAHFTDTLGRPLTGPTGDFMAGKAYMTLLGAGGALVASGGGGQTFDHYAITGVPGSSVAGVPFNVTFTAKDASNATITTYTGTAYLASSTDPLFDDSAGSFVAGVLATSFTLRTAGPQTISLRDNGTSRTSTSGAVTVSAGSAAAFVWSSVGDIPNNGTTGEVATITVVDTWSNPVAAYSGSVTIDYGPDTTLTLPQKNATGIDFDGGGGDNAFPWTTTLTAAVSVFEWTYTGAMPFKTIQLNVAGAFASVNTIDIALGV